MGLHSQPPLRDLVSPLTLAAYAAWGAVMLTLDTVAARTLMGVFLLGFVGVHLIGEQASMRRFGVLVSAMAAAALSVIWLEPNSAAPILLVLLAGMLAAALPPRRLIPVLIALNVLAAAAMFMRHPAPPRWVAVSVFAYASFQAFAALVMGYARRAEAMSAELRVANAELIATRALLADGVRDQERLRLSRELHDIAGHTLTALKLNLGALSRDPRQPDPERVALCAGLADELLQTLRGVVRQVRSDRGIDVAATIRGLGAPFPRPALHVDIADDVRIESIERAEAVLRTVQEALTNAARHSGADNLYVVLHNDGAQLRVEIRDDGRSPRRLVPGSGLAGMRERLRALGGDVDIDAADGDGLRLHAWLPRELGA